jgi:hypothetical protein
LAQHQQAAAGASVVATLSSSPSPRLVAEVVAIIPRSTLLVAALVVAAVPSLQVVPVRLGRATPVAEARAVVQFTTLVEAVVRAVLVVQTAAQVAMVSPQAS